MTNGQSQEIQGIGVEAVPAYNLTPARLSNHPKGRDNGYVLTMGGKRIYVSGDTEDIPEMLALKNINVAFVCMNQPTMDVDHAARAVKAFKPKIVYPYHYRGSDLRIQGTGRCGTRGGSADQGLGPVVPMSFGEVRRTRMGHEALLPILEVTDGNGESR